jgi:hypothetical protein
MIQRWCSEGKFSDGDLVREKKLLLFLQEVVIPMRTVPRTKKSMSQKLDSKRKRNAASKRRKRAKMAQENGKSVVGSMPDSSCPTEDGNLAASGEEDSDEEISSEVGCLNLFIVCYLSFYRLSHWPPTRSNQATFQPSYPYGKIKWLKRKTNTPILGVL